MLKLEQMMDMRTNIPLRGFTVVNGAGKVVALGAADSFVIMTGRKLERDGDLVAKVARITGMSVRLSSARKI